MLNCISKQNCNSLITNIAPISYYFIRSRVRPQGLCSLCFFSGFLSQNPFFSLNPHGENRIVIKINMYSHGGKPFLLFLDIWISLTETLTEDERHKWASVSSPSQIPSEKRAEASFTHMCGLVKASVSAQLSRLKAGFSRPYIQVAVSVWIHRKWLHGEMFWFGNAI